MGVPESVVTDNGQQFAAAEFQEFCHTNGINHILIAPYHPTSNGLAERGVRTFKEGYHKLEQGMVSDRVARYSTESHRIPQQDIRHLN